MGNKDTGYNLILLRPNPNLWESFDGFLMKTSICTAVLEQAGQKPCRCESHQHATSMVFPAIGQVSTKALARQADS